MRDVPIRQPRAAGGLVDRPPTCGYFSRVKLRVTPFIAFGSFGLATVFAACSSFGSAIAPTADASTVDSAIPSLDASIDASPSPEDADVDAAFDCRERLEDTFEARTPNGKWTEKASQPNLQGDYANQTASFTLPPGSDVYAVLNGPTFYDAPTATAEPRVVSIEFDLTIATLEPVGATLAQLPELTDQGNVRIEATALPGGSVNSGTASLFLVPNGPSASPPALPITVAFGKKERYRWTYARNLTDELTVTLQRVGSGDAPLQLKTTTKAITKNAYFQMGPFSNRGFVNAVQVVYDNVVIRTCSRR